MLLCLLLMSPRTARGLGLPSSPAMRLYKGLGESTRYTVSTAVATTLIARHDAATLRWVVGAVAASAANKGLKKIIKQTRPGSGDDDGMPSSHACAMANLGTSVLTNTWLGGTPWWCPLDPGTVTVGFLLYFLISASWRVTAKYHTPAQIVVGTAFGSFTSFAWRSLWAATGMTSTLDDFFFSKGILPVFAVVAALVAGAIVVLGYDDLVSVLTRKDEPETETR